jgi:hypothetical protein
MSGSDLYDVLYAVGSCELPQREAKFKCGSSRRWYELGRWYEYRRWYELTCWYKPT